MGGAVAFGTFQYITQESDFYLHHFFSKKCIYAVYKYGLCIFYKDSSLFIGNAFK